MYIRFVTSTANPDKVDELREAFTTQVLPGLQATKGCLFAGFIENAAVPNETSSLTLWDSAESIRAYEEGGRFAALLDATRPYFGESDEWQVQLSEDLTLEYKPVVEEPKPHSYRLCAVMDEEALRRDPFLDMHLRLLRLQVRRDGFEGLRREYLETVIPALRQVKGCRNAFLLEGVDAREKLFSLTIWDTREDAQAYDRGPVFQSLIEDSKALLSAQVWQATLKSHLGSEVYVKDDEEAAFYDVRAGRDFRSLAPRKSPNAQVEEHPRTTPKTSDSPSR